MKRIFIFCLCTIGLSSCNYVKNVNLLTSGDLDRENFTDSISFEMKKDLVIVKAQINGKDNMLDFIFDTGAFNSKINHTLTEAYNLETKAIKENEDSNGNVKIIEVTQLEKVQLGHTVFSKIGAGKVKYAEESPSPCIAEHGIIGANLIKLANWKIDYEKQMIYFSDKPFSVDNPSKAIVLDYDAPTLSATPKVNVKIAGRTVENLLIDTGSNGGFRLPSALQNAFTSTETQTYYDRSVSGIYGFSTDTLVIKTLPLDDFKTTFPIQFSALGKGLIGNEYLKYFKLYIDTDDDVITLEPQRTIETPKERPISFIPTSDNRWQINRVSANAKHGLKLGDTLLKINNSTPKDLYKDYCDYVMNSHEIYESAYLELVTVEKDTVIVQGSIK
ncbi:aspartyl protease family protein [uncultured Winogradskyella sp.]|uniref:aspartyl protease family protein n=1 Tax=uncultured Winogradskyella sp. TaxID=395353 RepID=UPI0035193FFA